MQCDPTAPPAVTCSLPSGICPVPACATPGFRAIAGRPHGGRGIGLGPGPQPGPEGLHSTAGGRLCTQQPLTGGGGGRHLRGLLSSVRGRAAGLRGLAARVAPRTGSVLKPRLPGAGGRTRLTQRPGAWSKVSRSHAARNRPFHKQASVCKSVCLGTRAASADRGPAVCGCLPQHRTGAR